MSSVLQLILEGERLDTAQMAQVLDLSEAAVRAEIERLQAEHILLGWRPVLNPERAQEDIVRAVIEVKISPERDGGSPFPCWHGVLVGVSGKLRHDNRPGARHRPHLCQHQPRAGPPDRSRGK